MVNAPIGCDRAGEIERARRPRRRMRTYVIIAAEALARQGTLITRDANVRKSGIVSTVW